MKRYGKTDRRRGVAVGILAVMLMLLVPVVGLAIDAGFLYVVKAKLSAASDAAALAAARSLTVGLTMAEQAEAAINRANAFFNANFPNGYMGSTNRTVDVSVAETAFRTRTVTVNAQVDGPVYFMRMLQFSNVTIRTTGRASRRDVNLILVLDRSGSMSGTPCTLMISAARNFVSQFANGRDRLAMITFSTSYHMAYQPNMNFKTSSPTLDSLIASISCTGNTQTAQALWKAYELLNTGINDPDITVPGINEPGALNLIVFFTDGRPNGIVADWPIKDKTDYRHQPGSSSSSTYKPSSCNDLEGDQWYRNAGQSYTESSPNPAFSEPDWNPDWFGPLPRPTLPTPVATKRGIITQWSGFADHGTTVGIFRYASTGGSSDRIADRAGCKFDSNQEYVRRDVAFIPNQDIYGNRTDCCYYTAAESHPSSMTYSTPIIKFTSGPYQGYMRPDHPFDIGKVSANAADNAATRIRNDTRLGIVIYSIGLGDTNPANRDGLDDVFLKRVSNINDPANAIYDPTRPEGMYVYAPNSTQLSQAFAQVASEILRIAR